MTPGEYIRSYYGVPAKRGGRVTYDGQPGTITGYRDTYLLVRLAAEPDRLLTLHPTWKVEYGRPPMLDQRCDVCGRFISNRRWSEYNCFAGDAYAYCEREPVPAGHDERQRWLMANAGRTR